MYSKEVWDLLNRKYNDNYYSGVEKRSSNSEVGSYDYVALMVFHTGEVSTKSVR